jgi:hypothetical protein
MTGFQNISSWQRRNPYRESGDAMPSSRTLARVRSLKGVSPNDVPYGDDEMELAFGQQVQRARQEISDYQTGPKFDMTRGGWQKDPTLQRDVANAISGNRGPAFMEALERAGTMAGNRGMRYRADLVGDGPGTGTGIGRAKSMMGRIGPGNSFRPETTSIDLEDLMTDADYFGNSNVGPNDRTAAMRALQMMTRGR